MFKISSIYGNLFHADPHLLHLLVVVLLTITDLISLTLHASLCLQELIQNAEDAGATKVKFLHDKNSYGTAQLYDDCEELSECQVKKRVIQRGKPM